MIPQEMQQNMQEMTADEAKASLGIATALQDKLMPQAPQEAQDTPGGEQKTQDEMAAHKQETQGAIDAIKKDLEQKITDHEQRTTGVIKQEVQNIKDMIQQLLEEDQNDQELTSKISPKTK